MWKKPYDILYVLYLLVLFSETKEEQFKIIVILICMPLCNMYYLAAKQILTHRFQHINSYL